MRLKRAKFEFYRDIYSSAYDRWPGYGSGPIGLRYIPYLLGMLGPDARYMLEVGCGNSPFLSRFVSEAPAKLKCYALDVYPQCKVPDGVEFLNRVAWDIEDLPQLDLIVSFDVLEHLSPEDVERTLEVWSRSAVRTFSLISLIPARLRLPHTELHLTVAAADWWAWQYRRNFGGRVELFPSRPDALIVLTSP